MSGRKPQKAGEQFALADDRDSSGQKSRPRFAVRVPTPPPSDFFDEVVEIGLQVSYRGIASRYLGAGEWVIYLAEGKQFVHMGKLYWAAVVYLRGFVDSVLDTLPEQRFLKLSPVEPPSGGNDQGNAPTFLGSGAILCEERNQTRKAAVI